jgi:hypothetical protein
LLVHSNHFPGQISVDRILEGSVSERTERLPEGPELGGHLRILFTLNMSNNGMARLSHKCLIVDHARIIIRLNITVGLDDRHHLVVHSEYECLSSGTLPMPSEMKLLSDYSLQMVNRIPTTSIITVICMQSTRPSGLGMMKETFRRCMRELGDDSYLANCTWTDQCTCHHYPI